MKKHAGIHTLNGIRIFFDTINVSWIVFIQSRCFKWSDGNSKFFETSPQNGNFSKTSLLYIDEIALQDLPPNILEHLYRSFKWVCQKCNRTPAFHEEGTLHWYGYKRDSAIDQHLNDNIVKYTCPQCHDIEKQLKEELHI